MKWNGEFDTDRIASTYFPKGFTGGVVDVGAADGINLSNTYAFEQMGWLCLCLEANADFTEALKRNRAHSMVCAVGAKPGFDELKVFEPPGQPGWRISLTGLKPFPKLISQFRLVERRPVQVKTLDQCIAEFGKFKTIDYVTVDVEGSEADVLAGFDLERWKPKLLVVEDFLAWKWRGERKYAAEHLSKRGYKLHRSVKYNDFYVPG